MHRYAAILLCLLLLLPLPVHAAPNDGGPLDPGELEALVDPVFQRHLADLHIPGAVFVVVRDGKVLFQKGYGVANVERQTPADPDRTLFAIGSITKLFTGTVIMQLAEQGKLDLHADVNQYLRAFQVPNTFPQPITAAHLLTHTAGFDELLLGISARTADQVEPLDRYLAKNLPARIRPPGQEYQYSNHGIALAGHLVEAVTGQSYERYLAEQILQPLGMKRTALGPPPDLAADLATPYRYTGSGFVQEAPWYLNVAPAGDLRATGTDMAAFMIAHLHKGRYGQSRIMQEETAVQMQTRQFTHHPALPGATYAFMERVRSGQRAIEHPGDVAGTTSLLLLVPEANWGFFVSYNAGGGSLARYELADLLLDYYAPTPVKPPVKPSTSLPLDSYAGTYQTNRYSHTDLVKLQLFGPGWTVSDNGDGTLTLRWPGEMRPATRLVQVEPLLFEQEDGNGQVAFGTDEAGRITRLYADSFVLALHRVPWYGRFELHLGLILALVLLALTIPAAALYRRIRRLPPVPAEVRRARWLACGAYSLILLIIGGLLAGVAANSMDLVFGLSPFVRGVLALPLLYAAVTVPLLWSAVRAWRSSAWTAGGRVYHTLLTLGALLYLPFLWYWNLL